MVDQHPLHRQWEFDLQNCTFLADFQHRQSSVSLTRLFAALADVENAQSRLAPEGFAQSRLVPE